MILFDSKTGNVKRFISKLNVNARQINEDLVVTKPFILVTYTTNFGEVPSTTATFLRRNGAYLQGVAVSGNRNWGQNFGLAGDKIAQQYGVPLLMKFEMSGTPTDTSRFIMEVDAIVNTRTELDPVK